MFETNDNTPVMPEENTPVEGAPIAPETPEAPAAPATEAPVETPAVETPVEEPTAEAHNCPTC